jgi:hypothetical protein
MKKLAFALAASFIASVASSQIASSQIAYVMLNEVQNVILDRYGIDYTGAHVRYMVETGEVYNLKDSATKDATKDSMLAAYNRFTKWNKGYFKSIPDTVYFSDGEEYMSGKQADNFLIAVFGNSRKILNMFSLDVNDFANNIQTIEILELYNVGMMPNYYIDHVIMLKDFNSRWSVFTFNSIYIGSDCPQCPVE